MGQDDPTWVTMTKNWETGVKHEAYIKYRTDDGTLDKMGALSAGPLKLSHYDLTDA